MHYDYINYVLNHIIYYCYSAILMYYYSITISITCLTVTYSLVFINIFLLAM